MKTRFALAAAAALISGAAMAQTATTNPSGSVVTTPGGVPLSTGVPTASSPGVPVGSLNPPSNVPGASRNPNSVAGGTEAGNANAGNDNGNSGGGSGGAAR